MNIIILYYNKKIKATVGKPSVLEASTLSVCLSVCLSVRGFTRVLVWGCGGEAF